MKTPFSEDLRAWSPRFTKTSETTGLWIVPAWSEYHDNGRVVRSGNTHAESRFFYDEAGNRTRQERWEDGELVYFTNFQTDELGRYLSGESVRLSIHEDYGNTGEWDRIRLYEHDELGGGVHCRVVDPATGKSMHRQTTIYNP